MVKKRAIVDLIDQMLEWSKKERNNNE